ncbi:MAG: sulfatase [Planctomycetota bacterium]|nr:sulfatase [Planctomycetota bacterium]
MLRLRDLARKMGAALLFGLVGSSCGSDPGLPEDAPNVLLITVDTLRYDHLGLAGYGRETSPNIDALAARGVSFERAYAPSPWTLPSMASIHTGLYPSSHTLQRPKSSIPLEATTLAEALKVVGYRTDAIVSNPIVHPRFGHSQGFDSFDTEDAKGHDHISTPGMTARAKALLADFAAHAAEGERFFLSLLYFDPHYDWLDHGLGFAPERAGRITGGESVEELRELADTTGLTDEEVAQLVARYDEEIAFTDAGIGELLDELERLGLSGNTVVVFVADHGEEFLEHGWLGHTRFLYEGMVRVPLVVSDPRAEASHGLRFSEPVSTVSVMPTILSLVGLDPELHAPDEPSLAQVVRDPTAKDLDPRIDGVVFSEVDFVPAHEHNLAKVAHLIGVVTRHFKWIQDTKSGAQEAFDLESDPGELEDLSAAWLAGESPEARRMAEASIQSLEVWQAACAERALPPHIGFLSDEEMEELNKLGYLDTGD